MADTGAPTIGPKKKTKVKGHKRMHHVRVHSMTSSISTLQVTQFQQNLDIPTGRTTRSGSTRNPSRNPLRGECVVPPIPDTFSTNRERSNDDGTPVSSNTLDKEADVHTAQWLKWFITLMHERDNDAGERFFCVCVKVFDLYLFLSSSPS